MGIQGKTVVFTGKISKPRHEFQALVGKHGGIAGSDVSSHTDYLVVGEKPGSKLARATILGIKMITEKEFLKLLKEEQLDEVPLSPEELTELKKNTVTLTCSVCKKEYKQWDSLLNSETCPTCEVLISIPLCPHCGNEPIFVTDYGLYHCMLCGTWFKAPHAIHARHTKHLCYFGTIKETEEEVTKRCMACNNTIVLSREDTEQHKDKYREAPALVKEWKERSLTLQVERRQKEELQKYFESLTPEQIHYLEEQLGKTYSIP